VVSLEMGCPGTGSNSELVPEADQQQHLDGLSVVEIHLKPPGARFGPPLAPAGPVAEQSPAMTAPLFVRSQASSYPRGFERYL